MKHTKGNWYVNPLKGKKYENKFYVLTDGVPCDKCGKGGDHRHICVTLESAVGLEQARANAKLIAAAPDLLEAIQPLINACAAMIEGEWAKDPDKDEDIINAKAAVKKASE